MPTSEIDDIFSSKGKHKAKVAQPVVSASTSSSVVQAQSSKKKKKDKKRKREAEAESTSTLPSSSEPIKSKRPPPETVIDSSAPLVVSAPPTKRPKTEKSSKAGAAKKDKNKEKEKESEARFKDSRGTGPRRTTEEGWTIYKEDELGIKDEGGDTPLCPFDCQCCF